MKRFIEIVICTAILLTACLLAQMAHTMTNATAPLNAESGYIIANSTTYLTVHNATTGTVSAVTYRVGQNKIATTYYIYRNFFNFTIPAMVQCLACTLFVEGHTDSSTYNEFTVCVMGARAAHPTLVSGDYINYDGHATYDSTNALGKWHSSAFSTGWNKIIFNSLGRDSVETASEDTLWIALISNRDFSATAPTGGEMIGFDYQAPRLPYLSFSYSEAGDPLFAITTSAATNITATTATMGGNITFADKNATIRGICYGATENPNTLGTKVQEIGDFDTDVFTLPVTGLTLGTWYHMRAFATNPDSTIYGEDILMMTRSLGPFYVANTGGDDGDDGLTEETAWATLAKADTAAVVTQSGALTIYLNKGDSWAEKVTVPHDSITYLAYGTGAPPIIAGTTWAVDLNGKKACTFTGIRFGQQVTLQGAAMGNKFNYCIIRNADSCGVYVNNTSSVTLNNCNIENCTNSGVYLSNASASAVMRNCLVMGNALSETGNYKYGLYAAGAGDIDLDYCSVTGNGEYPRNNYLTTSVTDGGHNQNFVIPKVKSYKTNKAYFSVTLDDNNTTQWMDVNRALSPYGVKFTFYANIKSVNVDSCIALVADGNELGCHDWSHTNLTSTTAFTISTTNADPVININRLTKTLTLTTSTSSPNNNVALSWVNNDSTIEHLNTALTGKGWTLALTDDVNNFLRLKALASSGGDQTTFPYAAVLDTTVANSYPFYTEEITDAITSFNTSVGTTIVTSAGPSGGTNATVQAFKKNVALLKGDRGYSTTSNSQSLSSVNIYNFTCNQTYDTTWKGDGLEATIRQCARNSYVFAMERGCAMVFLAHQSAQFSPLQWEWLVDEIQDAGGEFLTFSVLIDSIKADGHTTVDDMIYTKTYADVSNDSLLTGSPLINAGVDVGLTTDYIGNPIVGLPDIGAFEDQTPIAGGDRRLHPPIILRNGAVPPAFWNGYPLPEIRIGI